MDKQELVNAVIEDIKKDTANNDWTAIDALLYNVDPASLKGYLPEKENERVIDGSMVLGMYYAPNNYERALNPRTKKLRASTGSHVVLYFVHKLGACLERRIING